MNKGKIKILVIIILTIIGINNVKALSLPDYINEKTNYQVIVEDDANLLTEEELNKLQEEMKPLTKYGNIGFKTTESNYTTIDEYAVSYYREKFGMESGTIFIIDMSNRKIYVFSDGKNYNIITKSRALLITDNVYQYATNEDYYECASKTFSQIYTLLEGGKISQPMRHISNILIAMTIAFFINFIVILINRSIKKAKQKDIINNCNIDFNISDVNVKHIGTHREYSPRSSSSGGSSGGGGVGSSGGGGGHSF